jgi:hypothetical protein
MRKQSALRSANMSRSSASITPPHVQPHSAGAQRPSLPVHQTPTRSPTPPRRSPSPPITPPPTRSDADTALQPTSPPPRKKPKAAEFESPLTQNMSDEEHEFQPRTSPRKSSKAAASSATASKAKTSTSKRRRVESPAVSEGEPDEEQQVRRSPRKGAKPAAASKAKATQAAPKKRKTRK